MSHTGPGAQRLSKGLHAQKGLQSPAVRGRLSAHGQGRDRQLRQNHRPPACGHREIRGLPWALGGNRVSHAMLDPKPARPLLQEAPRAWTLGQSGRFLGESGR